VLKAWLWLHLGVQLLGAGCAAAGVVLVLTSFPWANHYTQ
jgi:hypothetical protein